jgi:hypothetical protein
LSAAEFIKQYDEYGVPFDADFIDYLRGLSFDERHAFDMAMGYVFGRISDLKIQLSPSGLYTLLKASNAGPEDFYNAHRDRGDLFSSEDEVPAELDRHSRAQFGNGWYPANLLPQVGRWMTDRSCLRFYAQRFSKIALRVTTHIPDLGTSPMELEFRLNGKLSCSFCLFEYGWLDLEIAVPETTMHRTSEFKLEIRASRTWQPSITNPNSNDDRHLSIALCDLKIN